MKKWMMTGLLVLGVSAAMAQTTKSHKTAEMRAAIKAQKISERYTLSADQHLKLEQELLISEEQIASKQAIIKKAREEAQLARMEQDNRIQAILTVEQRKSYLADKLQNIKWREGQKHKKMKYKHETLPDPQQRP